MTPEQMDQAMKDSIAAFPAATEGLGAQVLAPTVLPDGTKQFELTTRCEVGGVAGQDRRRHDLQRHRPGPDPQGRPRRPACASCCTTSCPSRRRSTSTG